MIDAFASTTGDLVDIGVGEVCRGLRIVTRSRTLVPLVGAMDTTDWIASRRVELGRARQGTLEIGKIGFLPDPGSWQDFGTFFEEFY